jgi:hypothetical protein
LLDDEEPFRNFDQTKHLPHVKMPQEKLATHAMQHAMYLEEKLNGHEN